MKDKAKLLRMGVLIGKEKVLRERASKLRAEVQTLAAGGYYTSVTTYSDGSLLLTVSLAVYMANVEAPKAPTLVDFPKEQFRERGYKRTHYPAELVGCFEPGKSGKGLWIEAWSDVMYDNEPAATTQLDNSTPTAYGYVAKS